MEELFNSQKNQEPDIILFGPRNGKALKSLYPELADNKRFKDLANEDLLFVWYFACKSSPIDDDLPDHIRAITSVSETSFKDPDKRKKFSNMEFPEYIKDAIMEMRKYEPKARDLANKIVQRTFNNFLKMSSVNVNEFVKKDDDGNDTTEIDFQARLQYINGQEKITSMLPSLLAQVEQGFGIIDLKTGKESAGEKTIDKFHEQKKNTTS
jgi:hypothetical protein